MRELVDNLLFTVIGIPLFILTIPFILLLAIAAYFQRKQFEKKYGEFLRGNNGKNFFCYKNRKNSKDYIEKNILPNLADGIEIVFLNEKQIVSKYDHEFIFEALNKLKLYIRFPRLMKIRNGKLIDKSLHRPFFNLLNLNNQKNKFLTRINEFFNVRDIKPLPSASKSL